MEIILINMFKYNQKEENNNIKERGETKMTYLIAKLIATIITYGIVILCGIIGIWGGLG